MFIDRLSNKIYIEIIARNRILLQREMLGLLQMYYYNYL